MREKMKLTAMRRTFFALFAMVLSMTALAQNASISGTVVDENGEPVIGASVLEKANTKNGVITNIDGQFSLKVNAGATLVVSDAGRRRQPPPKRGNVQSRMLPLVFL